MEAEVEAMTTNSLTGNDWAFVNGLALKIHEDSDIRHMRSRVLDLLGMLVPYDAATFFVSRPADGGHLSDPVSRGIGRDLLELYMTDFESVDYLRWAFASGQNSTFRASDLFPAGVRESTEFYQRAYPRANIHYSAIASIGHDGRCLGALSLYRSKDNVDFSDREIAIVDVLKDHLAVRLFREPCPSFSEEPEEAIVEHDRLCAQFDLSSREIEVLDLILDYRQNPEICHELFITQSTLKKHISSIYKKMNVNHRLDVFRVMGRS